MDEELPILGTEPLVVEYANTLHGGDHLGAPWCAAAGVAPFRDIVAARSLRDGIHALFTAAATGAAPPYAAIALVNAVAAAAPTYPQLVPQPTGGLAADRRDTTTGDRALLGSLATACVELLTDGRARLLRRCLTPDCHLFFLQHHPRRRYCHDSCAHRDRQARYYHRNKGNGRRSGTSETV
ncbi:hypothetical protein GCM10009557_02540 [Virgisporangium ochraceum]|uniref:Zinc finger CGNR domain-containing protein n=1 Tax=Virgisporangium ochraceum TaxID=65505 RepID=A0A8J4EFK7_9ACTN|nr:ABATE domain-containing protein [Virgisporangium ochraceum]GIJ72821.1 hypothetical protein Voc01_077380 [Virgisporangium ochraceum]